MGIVRQSLIGTALAYLGVIIGYINTLYVRPEFLDLSQVGIFNLVTANAMLIAPLCTAGMTGSVIKFFPQFKNAGTINQFFTFLVSVTIIVNSAVLLLGFVLKNVIVGLFEENAADYVQYLTITAIIIVCNSLFDLIYAFCKSLMKIIVPSFLRDIFLRVASIVLVGGYGLDYWSFDIAVQGLGFTYVISLTALLVYLLIKQGFRLSVPFNILDKGILRRIISFGGYSMLLAGSYAMINNIGYIQVSSLIGDEANGIFATCFIIGIIVEIPKRNMLKVLAPQFSKAMEDEDLSKVNRLYEKGSITLSVFGGLLFIGILTNINDLFIFIPQGERFTSGFWLIVFVCLAKLTGMVFSFSQEILVFSRYNIWALVYQITAVVVLVAINYLLIPRIGITGAGISYFVAILIQILLKLFLVYKKFHIIPFTWKHVEWLAITAGIFIIFWKINLPFDPIINIVVRSVMASTLYGGLVYNRRISRDINELIDTIITRQFKRN